MITKNEIPFLIWVRCFTYNQSLYIKDALDGFCIQRTDFPFVCTIVDDASTDGTVEIINKYLADNFEIDGDTGKEEREDYQLILARNKRNQNCYFAVLFLKENHYNKKPKWPYLTEWSDTVKYHAICEGDDYWTDENKLQRQFDFLQAHPDCSAISENGIELYTESGEHKLFSEEPARFLSIGEMVEKRRFPTASVLYRKEAFEKYKSSSHQFDTMLWCILASQGKLYYDAIVSSVYRRGPGVTVTVDPYTFTEWIEGMYWELLSLFPQHLKKREIEKDVVRLYIAAANRYIKQKSFSKRICSCYKKGVTTNFGIFIVLMIQMYSGAFIRLVSKEKTKK